MTGVKVRDYRTGKIETPGADLVINAAGPWAEDVAAMAERLTDIVCNKLGVRAIVIDFGISSQAEKRLSQVLTVVGVLTVAYGLWLTWVIIH